MPNKRLDSRSQVPRISYRSTSSVSEGTPVSASLAWWALCSFFSLRESNVPPFIYGVTCFVYIAQAWDELDRITPIGAIVDVKMHDIIY